MRLRFLLVAFGLLFFGGAAHAQNCIAPTTAVVPGQLIASGAYNCLLPHVDTNLALTRLATTAISGGIWRNGFTSPGDAPPLFYQGSNSACSLNAGAGDNGSQVKSADSKCWLAVFPPTGVDIREFGATTSGDAGPPIRAAYAASVSAGLPLLLRPAKAVYQILTLDPAAFNGSFNGNGPYPNTVQPGLYFGSQSGTTNNVTVDFGGVTLQMSGTGCTTLPAGYGNNCAAAEVVMFDNIHNLQVTGTPTLNGINSGPIGPATELCALAMFNLVDFNIGAINFTNFGGIGAATCGDWLVHGHVADIYAPQVNRLADMAFLNDVIFDHWYGRSANTSGVFAPQGIGFSVIYDTANNGQNKTGISFTSTTNWTIANSDASGFNTCASISEGNFIRLRGNYWHGCTGTSSPVQPGVGVLVRNNDSIASGGINPADVSSVGDHYSGNGNTTAGSGDFILYFNPSIVTGALGNVSLVDGIFDNYPGGSPTNNQIGVTTAQHTNFTVQGNVGLIQSAVSIGSAPASGINRVDVPQTWTPTLEFGGAFTGQAYSVQHGLWSISGRQMTASFSLTLTSKGTATGQATVIGLPFPANTTQDCGVIANIYGNMATAFVPSGVVLPNSSTIFITKFGGTGFTNVADTDFSNTSQIDMSMTCQIN